MEIIDIVNWILILVNIPMLVIFFIWFIVLLFPKKIEHEDFLPKVTVLIPVYNEEENIGRCLSSILRSNYPKNKLEVIVIDDGSTDNTGEKAREAGVKVVRTKHIGKSRALNEGLRKAKGDVIIVIDSDIRIEEDTIKKLASKFKDPRVGVVSGMVRTRGSSLIERFQKIEFAYISTLINRHYSAGIPIPFVYGAVSAFRRDALESIGGFKWRTIAEDSDTYLELVFKGWKAATADTKVYTEPVKSLKELLKQRKRWMLGGLQVFFEHIQNFGKSIIGIYVLPLFGFWPFGAGVSLSANAYVFAYWFNPKSLLDAVIYVLRWISFIGVPLGLMELPSWGFPPAATTGILVGLMALLVLVIGVVKSRERIDPIDVVLMVFYPIYGWLILGTSGILALIEFACHPSKTFKR